LGSWRNSSVKRRHSRTFSGDTKSTATFVHDYARFDIGWLGQQIQSNYLKGKNQKFVKRYLTLRFLTWCGHPAGINTASPSFCSKVHGSTPKSGASR
jgi:hypothetical protein